MTYSKLDHTVLSSNAVSSNFGFISFPSLSNLPKKGNSNISEARAQNL
ncbi:MAG: hypothetical protein ACM3JQ_01220 [Candidatus Eiseniibacteriota bacterium]